MLDKRFYEAKLVTVIATIPVQWFICVIFEHYICDSILDT